MDLGGVVLHSPGADADGVGGIWFTFMAFDPALGWAGSIRVGTSRGPTLFFSLRGVSLGWPEAPRP
jgi:hypothetical protein